MNNVQGGTVATAHASIELPDGARIKRIVFYGVDTSAANDIGVQLIRAEFSSLAGAPTLNAGTVTSFSTAGVNGTTATASADNLNEVVGSFTTTVPYMFHHRFHTIRVTMTKAAGGNHKLCGVEVQYQVPMSSADPGTVFHPIDPVRVYDSRQAAYAPNGGLLGPNQARVISIKDARDTSGNLVASDVVPAGATAITYNVTVAGPTGPNFLAVTPGDAGSFTASAINFDGTADIANAGTTKIAADRTVKVWGGDQSGSMHVLIDVTGYFAAPVAVPNMGN